MSAGLWVLIVAIVAASAFGLWRAMTDGRLRGTRAIDTRPDQDGPRAVEESAERAESPWADRLGDRATLVQFSSAFCAPCRTTRQVLGRVADELPGVVHIEVDAEHHLELVRELGIMRTPTTLILGPDGVERFRATGVPRHDQVIAAF